MKVVVYTDGASRGNPGPASYGFVIYEGRERIAEGFEAIGIATNNFAEYTAVIRALERCLEMKVDAVTIRSDSQLLVRQLNRQYKVKAPQIIPLHKTVSELARRFQSTLFEHVPREENREADALANRALDS